MARTKRHGAEAHDERDPLNEKRKWEAASPRLRRAWKKARAGFGSGWNEARDAARDAWDSIGMDADYSRQNR